VVNPTPLFDLTGQVAVVTGVGAGGLGERAALALAGQGATIAVADLARNKAALEEIASRCRPGATAHAVDVTDEASVRGLADAVVAAHGRVDVVVNAAGVMLRRPVEETALDEFEHVVRVNLTGAWLVGREFGVRMRAAGRGRVVFISTVYAERVGPIPESAYYASKAGVANLTRSLAAEFGKDGVTVNCLAPAVFYPTAMTAPLADDPAQLAWFSARTMLGRLGDPDTDFAGPLLLLSTAASAYMTGQVVYVDGGWSGW
jgi:gluconate 5-dehydrogenase